MTNGWIVIGMEGGVEIGRSGGGNHIKVGTEVHGLNSHLNVWQARPGLGVETRDEEGREGKRSQRWRGGKRNRVGCAEIRPLTLWKTGR